MEPAVGWGTVSGWRTVAACGCAAALALAALVGCGGGDTDDGSDQEAGPPSEQASADGEQSEAEGEPSTLIVSGGSGGGSDAAGGSSGSDAGGSSGSAAGGMGGSVGGSAGSAAGGTGSATGGTGGLATGGMGGSVIGTGGSAAGGAGAAAPSAGSSGAGATSAMGGSGATGDSSPADGAAAGAEPWPPIEPGQLTAGEWSDLENWDFFQEVLSTQDWGTMEAYWGFETSGRIPVQVVANDTPVVNAQVSVFDVQGESLWMAVSDAYGQAELFTGMFGEEEGPFTIRATLGDESDEVQIDSGFDEFPVVLSFTQFEPPPPALDLMFVVDTTGSMSDELRYIQAELADVIQQVESGVGEQLSVRLSVNFYRDTTDAYVVRTFPFTTDIPQALDALAEQNAEGGGDFPEAVDQALQAAVEQQAWDPDATARLLFLVLDAPPHHVDECVTRVQVATEMAAAQGIAIVPVSASGIDKDTEFLLRFLSVATGGTYVFLTDDSGIGGSHLPTAPTIGQYEVEYLNDLMVRLIMEQLGYE